MDVTNEKLNQQGLSIFWSGDFNEIILSNNTDLKMRGSEA